MAKVFNWPIVSIGVIYCSFWQLSAPTTEPSLIPCMRMIEFAVHPYIRTLIPVIDKNNRILQVGAKSFLIGAYLRYWGGFEDISVVDANWPNVLSAIRENEIILPDELRYRILLPSASGLYRKAAWNFIQDGPEQVLSDDFAWERCFGQERFGIIIIGPQDASKFFDKISSPKESPSDPDLYYHNNDKFLREIEKAILLLDEAGIIIVELMAGDFDIYRSPERQNYQEPSLLCAPEDPGLSIGRLNLMLAEHGCELSNNPILVEGVTPMDLVYKNSAGLYFLRNPLESSHMVYRRTVRFVRSGVGSVELSQSSTLMGPSSPTTFIPCSFAARQTPVLLLIQKKASCRSGSGGQMQPTRVSSRRVSPRGHIPPGALVSGACVESVVSYKGSAGGSSAELERKLELPSAPAGPGRSVQSFSEIPPVAQEPHVRFVENEGTVAVSGPAVVDPVAGVAIVIESQSPVADSAAPVMLTPAAGLVDATSMVSGRLRRPDELMVVSDVLTDEVDLSTSIGPSLAPRATRRQQALETSARSEVGNSAPPIQASTSAAVDISFSQRPDDGLGGSRQQLVLPGQNREPGQSTILSPVASEPQSFKQSSCCGRNPCSCCRVS